MSPTLPQRIQAELQDYASRGELPPYRLTLTAMATHFGVSTQPVRTAVEELLRTRWLLREPGRKLRLNPRRRGSRARGRDPQPNFEDLQSALLRQIIRRSLRGERSFLREENVAASFGVGRTQVRGALARLAGSGVLEHVPRRGWRIEAFSERRMLEYLDLREQLELHALELSRGRLDPAMLRRVLERNTPTHGGRPRIDDGLHACWIQGCGNRYIGEFFERYGRYYSTLFDYASFEGEVIAEMASQHREILLALLDDRQAVARRALREHIRAQRPNVRRLMERFGAAEPEERR